MKNWKNAPLNQKVLVYILSFVFMAMLLVGFTAYTVSKKELDEKGRLLLQNSVIMATAFADEKYKDYHNGLITKERAIKEINELLLGDEGQDGMEGFNTKVNLGNNGYFMMYDTNGHMLIHPDLEGVNTWNYIDPTNPEMYLIQDQVQKALEGGGFTYYSWNLPNSEKIKEKVAYSGYSEKWGYVITATTYMEDFNKGAKGIIQIVFFATFVMMLLVTIFSAKFINNITRPIEKLSWGMKEAEYGRFKEIEISGRNDEIGQLLIGYNQMVRAIELATQRLSNQADHISYLAYHDTLSNLPNRNKFENYVLERIDLKPEKAYLIQIDIRDFKLINSIQGNLYGDKLISLMGVVFSEINSPNQMLARTSSNEFSAWVENWDEGQLVKNIEDFKMRINDHLKEMEVYENIEFHVSIASFPNDGDTYEIIYKKASIAMKFAKEERRIKLYFFQNEMEEIIENERHIKDELKDAILNKEFFAVYQAKVNIFKDNCIVGVEGLARWQKASGEIIGPNFFIPAITNSNLTIEFGIYMLNLILNDYGKIVEKYGSQTVVSINISPLFFIDKGFCARTIDAINKYNVPPEKVILEITEDVLITDFDYIQNVISELKRFGIRIALDDFGTGYSSLNYLQNIDIDELKIDKSFIEEILYSEKALIRFESIVRIAKAYDYDIVAEGIETFEQLEQVKKANLDFVQGYYFSKPEKL